MGGSEPEVIREHTTAFGQRRRERVVEPRETLQQKDQRLAKAPPRQKKADDHARFLEKRAKPSRGTPRPPTNDKTKEKTWSESERMRTTTTIWCRRSTRPSPRIMWSG